MQYALGNNGSKSLNFPINQNRKIRRETDNLKKKWRGGREIILSGIQNLDTLIATAHILQ